MWDGYSLRQAQGRLCPSTLTMSNRVNPMRKPLTGVRVLVGRAKHQAGALSTELRKRGAEVIEIPFIEIRKPKSFKPLDAAAEESRNLRLAHSDQRQWRRSHVGADGKQRSGKKREGHDFSLLRIAAIGPATQKAIEQRGMKVDVVPKEYVAESVVQELEEQSQREARASGPRESCP